MILGIATGWTISALPTLMNPASTIVVTTTEASWIASFFDIGVAIGCITSAITVPILGTKTSFFVVGLITAVGFIFLAVANSVYWIYLSRLISGIGLGTNYITYPFFVGEISSPKYRGAIFGIVVVGSNVGLIVAVVLAGRLDFSMFSFIVLGMTFIYLVTLYWLPKTPHHLILHNKLNEAAASMRFYRHDVDADTEVELLQNFIKSKTKLTFKNVLSELMITHNIKTLIKFIILLILVQISGQYAVSYYAGVILKNMEHKALILFIIEVASLGGALLAMLTSDIVGRKNLLVISCSIISLCFIVIGITYILLDMMIFDEILLQYILVVALLFRTIAFYSVVTDLGIILSEIFAPNVKYISLCIVDVVSGLATSASIKLYQPLLDLIGYNIYFLYAFIMIIVCIYIIIFMIETKGKTLQEIQEMLETK